MRLLVCTFILGALVPGPLAFGDDDDGVMGNWQGAFAGKDWEQRTIAAQIIAQGNRTWRMVLAIGEPGKPETKGEINGKMDDKGVGFAGEVDLGPDWGGAYEVDAALAGDVLSGRLKRKGERASFELRRVTIASPTLGAASPEGAVVLMDGTDLDAWERHPLKWNLVDEGAMEVCGSSLLTKQTFGSCKLHLEFRTPFQPKDRGQGRGNSGVYVQGRYEVQVLDSFGLDPADNLCGGIYKLAVPLVNACLPPLSWQTYDMTFHAPKFDAAGQKIRDAKITVLHNGIVIHDAVTLAHATPGGVSEAEAATGPLLLQDHGNAVRYRNIWVQPIED